MALSDDFLKQLHRIMPDAEADGLADAIANTQPSVSIRVNKSKGASASMHERIEYSHNPEKTEDGELITAYAWQPATAAEERGLCPVLHRAGTDEGSCQCEKK